MRRCVIAFFTGTGNSARAARRAGALWAAARYEIEYVELGIDRLSSPLAAEDALVACFPTYGFSAPRSFLRGLRRLPKASGAKAYLLACCGASIRRKGNEVAIDPGWTGVATRVVAAALRGRGFDPIAACEVSYPQNWTQAVEPDSPEGLEAMTAAGDASVDAFAASIEEGDRPWPRRGPLSHTIIRFVGFLFRHLASRVLGKLYVADADCVACGLCERACPAGSIRMEHGRPRWTLSCAACNRCINLCPTKAIQTSVWRLALMPALNAAIFIASFPLASAALSAWGFAPDPRSLLGAALHAAAAAAAYAALTAAQVVVVDAAWRAVERRFAFASRSFTKPYRRYLAQGFTAREYRGAARNAPNAKP